MVPKKKRSMRQRHSSGASPKAHLRPQKKTTEKVRGSNPMKKEFGHEVGRSDCPRFSSTKFDPHNVWTPLAVGTPGVWFFWPLLFLHPVDQGRSLLIWVVGGELVAVVLGFLADSCVISVINGPWPWLARRGHMALRPPGRVTGFHVAGQRVLSAIRCPSLFRNIKTHPPLPLISRKPVTNANLMRVVDLTQSLKSKQASWALQ